MHWLPSVVSVGKEAETDYLARLPEAVRYCTYISRNASSDPEAKRIRLELIERRCQIQIPAACWLKTVDAKLGLAYLLNGSVVVIA